MGIPIVIRFSYFILPFYRKAPESKQAIIASFTPALVLTPKLLSRVIAQKLQGINHIGTSGVLLIAPYTIVFRVLQALLHSFDLFVLLSFTHGLAGAIDKLLMPLQDFVVDKWCCKRSHRQRAKSLRANRLLTDIQDIALLSIVVEASSLFVNCVIVQIFRFYYGRDKGMRYDGYKLFIDFLWHVAIALFIE